MVDYGDQAVDAKGARRDVLPTHDSDRRSNRTSLLFLFSAAALVFGVFYRVIPNLFDGAFVARFFPTEDGYLMLTVSRNMALGNGMTISDGEIMTNGFQPLATFLFAGFYLLFDGDKVESVRAIMFFSVLVAIAGGVFFFDIARQALKDITDDISVPLLATAIWFIGPKMLFHSMNALETGLYTLLILVTLSFAIRVWRRGNVYSISDKIVLGVLCGLLFLARNDGVFFIAALFFARFLYVQFAGIAGFWEAVREAILPGVLSILVASPWLVSNYINFGSIVPISGPAQSLYTHAGKNFPILPTRLIETMFPISASRYTRTNLPDLIEWPLMLVVLGCLGMFIASLFRRERAVGFALAAYLLFAFCLVVYYGVLFGVSWFLYRYFAPFAPVFIIAAVYAILRVLQWVAPQRANAVLTGVGGMSLLTSTVMLLLIALPPDSRLSIQRWALGTGFMHVVDWVDENVEPDVWVAAVNSGTLGYWHDRTINLDGKVNPFALEARLQPNGQEAYLVDGPTQIVADWNYVKVILDPEDDALIRDNFTVRLDDEAGNLFVLERAR